MVFPRQLSDASSAAAATRGLEGGDRWLQRRQTRSPSSTTSSFCPGDTSPEPTAARGSNATGYLCF